MIITKTSHRLSICGGGTDLPSVASRWGGLVVGGAISLASYVTVRPLPPFHSHRSRIVYSEIELVKDHKDIQHAAVKACLEQTKTEGGVEVFYQSDIPARSGTGSSSTFVVGLLNALYAEKGIYKAQDELASEAIFIERDVLRENVGSQDQVFAAHTGSPAQIYFHKDGSYTYSPLGLSNEHQQELESHLLIFFTGISRNSTEVAEAYYHKLEQTADRHFAMVRLAEKSTTAIQDRDYELLGKCVENSYRLKCSLSDKVAPNSINRLLIKAGILGGWGGKIMGAGGGGCCLVVAPPEKHPAIIKGMQEELCVHLPFVFSPMGSHVIYSKRDQ